jgi:hypothetical protein
MRQDARKVLRKLGSASDVLYALRQTMTPSRSGTITGKSSFDV